MNTLDILEQDGDQVLWRYAGNDGTSQVNDGKACDAELCDTGLMLTTDTRAAIKRQVNDWLDYFGHLRSFDPDWVSPPGDTIKDILAEQGMTYEDLAAELGISDKKAERLCQGAEPLTEDIARALSATFSGSVGFWLEREAQYREGLK